MPTIARAQLIQALGKKRVQILERCGRLVIRQDDPTGSGVAGAVDRFGVIHLVASNLENGDALSVALHEAIHLAANGSFTEKKDTPILLVYAVLRGLGLKKLISYPRFSTLAQQAYRLAAMGNRTAMEALAKAGAEYAINPNTDIQQEFVAYLVQYANAKQSFIRRFLTIIQVALFHFGIKVTLTPEAVRALALSILKTQARVARMQPTISPIWSTYSRSNIQDLTLDQQFEHAVAGLKLLAGNPDLFKYPSSKQTDLAAIAGDLSPEIRVAESPSGHPKAKEWVVTMPGGVIAGIYLAPNGYEVHLNASLLIKGKSRGSLLYQLVGQWAHRNSKVFIGDPFGITDAGRARRLEHLISLALKFGTTDHLLPHPDQAIPWRVDNPAYNLAQMLKISSTLIQQAVPELKQVRYDFERQEFINTVTERSLGKADFEKLANSRGARAAQAGATTLKRSIFVNTVVQGAGREVWRHLLGELAQLSYSERLNPEVAWLFYSRLGRPLPL